MYGINVKTLDLLIKTPAPQKVEGGERTVIFDEPSFSLEKLDLEGSYPLKIPEEKEATIFTEEGGVSVSRVAIPEKTCFPLRAGSAQIIATAPKKAICYVFSGPRQSEGVQKTQTYPPFDYREKYWGYIESFANAEYAGKKIFCAEGKYSSLEFHCKKLEGYYVHKGTLFVRLRAGRGEDSFFELPEGSAIVIPPGLMHQRGGIKDATIMEISTHDDDGDSYLIEDGQRVPMPKLEFLVGSKKKPSAKRICFDIDGCICSQTDGEYGMAKPNAEAVALVNKLYNEGYTIVLYTARFMNRNSRNGVRAWEDGYAFTKNQLSGWGVKHHELVMGKPPADIIIDDRAVFFEPKWDVVEKGIRDRLNLKI